MNEVKFVTSNLFFNTSAEYYNFSEKKTVIQL